MMAWNPLHGSGVNTRLAEREKKGDQGSKKKRQKMKFNEERAKRFVRVLDKPGRPKYIKISQGLMLSMPQTTLAWK